MDTPSATRGQPARADRSGSIFSGVVGRGPDMPAIRTQNPVAIIFAMSNIFENIGIYD
jgi:hypothetical protein